MVSARAVLLLTLVSGVAVAQQHRPTVLLNGDRVLVALPESILRDRAVRARLDSALTTTFILKSRIRGETTENITRIEVRYDLWDDVYRVARKAQSTAVKPAQLDIWWRAPIEIAHFAGDRATVEIDLIVLPFSAAEESDAREWLSKSGGARDPSADSKGVVSVLVGTTLSARPVVSYHWTAEIVRR
jgi:hypothetical protein